MLPMNAINILALAACALAVPYHGHGHGHVRRHQTSGWSSAPYGTANATATYGSGTGTATADPTTTTATLNYASNSAGSATDSFSVNPASDSVCSGNTVTVKTKAYVTVTVTADGPSGSSGYASSTGYTASSVVAPVSSASNSITHIISTVHVTRTNTLPASGSPSISANSTSYSLASAYSSSSSSSWSAPTDGSSVSYTLPVESTSATSSEVAPVATSAPAYSSAWSATSSIQTPSTTSSSTEIIPITSSSTTSSAATASSTASSSGTGKRGVAYNDASLTECFLNKPAISWAYNWGSSCTGLNSAFNFIPMLWGTASEWTNSWSANAETAIAAGSTHLFSFNEPDMSTQSNLSPADAAAGWKTYMEPFAGKAKLCAPAVTNGGGAMGLDWLAAFLDACTDCTIDCVNIHWYDSAQNADYFKSHVQNATDISGGKSVFVSEFGATGSDSDVSTFLGEVMPWLDSQSWMAGYAYFMVSDGKLLSGTEPSTIGSVYAGSS